MRTPSRDVSKRFAKLRRVTLPPSDPTPEIPGASSWKGGAAPPRPVFTSPNPTRASSGPTQQFELASWAARAAAQLLDILFRLAIVTAITVAAWSLLAKHPFSWGGSTAFDSLNEAGASAYSYADFNLAWLIITAVGAYIVAGLIYAPITMAIWRGATPGKRIARIRVVRADGRDLSLSEAFVREPIIKGLLIGWIGGSIVFVPLLNYLWPLWDAECRAGHDFLARTRVVRAHGR